MRRRTFIKGAAVGTGLALAPRQLLKATGSWRSNSVPAELVAAAGSHQYLDGLASAALKINSVLPSPTISLTRGERFATRLVNQLDQPTILHWHGLLAPADMDGQPRHAIDPGEERDYDFVVDQGAGTFWYHPHPHHHTAEQVYAGMAGFFLIHDPEEDDLNLPAGEFDLPILLQDKKLDSEGEAIYEPSPMDVMNGWQGDSGLMNGKVKPVHPVSDTLYRLRFLNGSNARIFKLALDPSLPMHLIANDAGLLDRPREVDALMLGPGSRADVLVDFSGLSEGTRLELRSLEFPGDGAVGSLQGSEIHLGTFRVEPAGSSNGSIPGSLRSLDLYDESDVARERSFRLHRFNMQHAINDYVYRMNDPVFDVPMHQLEIWEFTNPSLHYHPMHVHGVHFQVLERNGSTDLPPEDLGWNDTVLVAPYDTVRVLVKFTAHDGIYMLHCHNLEHEDDGMMMDFRVTVAGGTGKDRRRGFAEIEVKPNIVRTSARLSVDSAAGGTALLYDGAGRHLRTLQLDGGGNAFIDRSGLAPGKYWISCGGNSTTFIVP